MIVGKRMSTKLITVPPDLTLPEAFALMKKENIRRLVIVDRGKMVGLVTKNDLENALPSKATSLSIWEINYLVEKVKVSDVMIKDVITVNEETPIEEAARLLGEKKISCLPVLRNNDVVGIITETDLFQIFLEVLGALHTGIRFSAELSAQPGSIAKLTQAIYQAGGNIIAFGTFIGESISKDEVTVKVQGVDVETLKAAIEPFILNLLSISEVI